MITAGVDFDGVLCRSTEWEGTGTIRGTPVPGARQWLESLIDAGIQPVVVSSRALSDTGRLAIEAWLYEHMGQRLLVTGLKVGARVYVDDRGWRFNGTFPTPEELKAFETWEGC